MAEEDQVSNFSKSVKHEVRMDRLSSVNEKMNLKDSEITRLWSDNSNNLAAFSDENRVCTLQLKEFIADALGRLKSKGSKFVDDLEYRWMASHFLLFNDANFLSLGFLDKSQHDSISSSCPTIRRMADHLKRVIFATALTIPELKKEAEDIMNSEKTVKEKPSDRPTVVVKSSQESVAIVKSAEEPVKAVGFELTPRISLQPYNPAKIDLGNTEMTRLWNINPNNLDAFADQHGRGAPNMVEFIQNMLDEIDLRNSIGDHFKPLSLEKIRWVASNFLLFNSDLYLLLDWEGQGDNQVFNKSDLGDSVYYSGVEANSRENKCRYAPSRWMSRQSNIFVAMATVCSGLNKVTFWIVCPVGIGILKTF